MPTIHDSSGKAVGSDNPLSVTISGANSSGGAVNVDITQSDAIVPMDIQNHLQQTIQTHNAISVGTSAESVGSWIDTNGFDKVAVTVLNDASTANYAYINWSNDGTNQHGYESIIPSASANRRSAITDTKARYMAVVLGNSDTASHTMSAWAYLKA